MKELILKKGMKCLIDDEDFDDLSKFTWRPYRKKGNLCYVSAQITNPNTGKRGHVFMHRFLFKQWNPSIKIDHIDGNGLNNQRKNLRECTHSQNLCNSKLSSKNTSGFKGVYYRKDEKKFMAYIRHNYKMYNLGLFKTVEEAAKARDKKTIELHGEFGRLNFPKQY